MKCHLKLHIDIDIVLATAERRRGMARKLAASSSAAVASAVAAAAAAAAAAVVAGGHCWRVVVKCDRVKTARQSTPRRSTSTPQDICPRPDVCSLVRTGSGLGSEVVV